MPKKNKKSESKNKKKRTELAAPPPRTSHFDKKKGKQVSRAVKIDETNTQVSYQWTEDTGGKDVQVKRRTLLKDHAKARFENKADPTTGSDSWVSDCGNHCKINKDKFDPNYDEIFGKKKRGAAAGKYKKFKKKY